MPDSIADAPLGANMTPGRANTPPAATPSPAQQPEWSVLLARIQQDMLEVHGKVAEISDHIGSVEAEIGTLLDLANELTSEALGMLSDGTPTRGIVEDVFYKLVRPLALLQGAASMARSLKVDVFSDAISRAYSLLDECYDNLDHGILGKLLPEGQPITFAEPPAKDQRPEKEYGTAAQRLELACQACHEIMKLAEAMQLVNEAHGEEEHPIAHGIMARIIVLSEIVFHGAELHGEDPAQWGTLPMNELRRAFKGAL